MMIIESLSPDTGNLLSAMAVILGGAILFVQNNRQKKETKDVKETLTQNNGGSTVKDKLDSLLASNEALKVDQEAQNNRLFRIESILMGKPIEKDKKDD